jgi:hypothetical protein
MFVYLCFNWVMLMTQSWRRNALSHVQGLKQELQISKAGIK